MVICPNLAYQRAHPVTRPDYLAAKGVRPQRDPSCWCLKLERACRAGNLDNTTNEREHLSFSRPNKAGVRSGLSAGQAHEEDLLSDGCRVCQRSSRGRLRPKEPLNGAILQSVGSPPRSGLGPLPIHSYQSNPLFPAFYYENVPCTEKLKVMP